MARCRALAVTVLLLLAGCQGVGTDVQTVTPAPVPTASGAEAVGAGSIADRHLRTLVNRSYTTTVALTVEYPNGTTARLTDEFTVGSDGVYRYDRRVRGPYPEPLSNFSIWQTNGTEFTREQAENGTTVVRVSDTTGFDDITFAGFLRRVLSGFDRTTDRENGRTLLTGSQTGPLTVPLPAALGNGRDATLDAEIRDDIVRSVTVRARADHADISQPVTVQMQFFVERVGQTDPVRPAWATESRASA